MNTASEKSFLLQEGKPGSETRESARFNAQHRCPAKTSSRWPAQVIALQQPIEIVSRAAKTCDFAAQRALHSLPKNPLRGVSVVASDQF